MKFPHSMLLDFVQTKLDAQELGDLLTMAGFELEGTEVVDGEPVFDIKVMSNRGDGLSVFGLSREVLAKDAEARPTALYQRAEEYFGDVAFETSPEDVVTVQTEDCTRYGAALFELGQGTTPGWMATRLTLAGMRPISLLVDVTNYVLLEIGQPLHAFDRDRLAGGKIVVRKARPGERMSTLDGTEHELRPDQMMICDVEKPVAVAGVIGGLESEVTESTHRVLLESAHFVNTSIRRTRKQLNLNTEASYRFERSVDRELVQAGLARTVDLLQQITGRKLEPRLSAFWGPDSPARTISFRVSRATKLLGMPVTEDEARSYLSKLGFGVVGEGDRFEVTVPTWRQDIESETDLVEEVGRVHGFERIPESMPVGTTTNGGVRGSYRQRDRLIEAMVRLGYVQIISHSLRTDHPLDAESPRIAPRVPASPEYAILRNALLPNLADAFRRNGGRDLCLFEVGRVFAADERIHLGVLASGMESPQRKKTDVVPEIDFFSLKGVLETALGEVGVSFRLKVPTEPDRRLHPTRQANVLTDGEAVGLVGQIHPDLAREIGLPPATILAEINLERALESAYPELVLREFSRHPAVRRDISLLVDKSIPYEQLDGLLVEAAGDVLEKHWLFDVYEGKGLPEGKHALGIALVLRKLDSTFTDEEANQVRERIVAALASTGASTR